MTDLAYVAQKKSRSWQFKTPPKDVRVFSVLAVICAAVSALLTVCTGQAVWQVLNEAYPARNVVLAGAIIFSLVSFYPLLPALRGFQFGIKARKALNAGDLTECRASTEEAKSYGWVSIGQAATILVLVGFIHFLMANDIAVGRTFFYAPLMVETFPLILKSFLTNVYIFLVAEVFVLVVGLLVAVARLAPGKAGKPIRTLAILYADIFRGLPAIVTIYLVGFGLPLTGLPILKDLSRETLAIIALTLTMSAYVSEIYRAGIESIHKSQTAAARSLGLSHFQTLRFVIVPQAVRTMVPPLLNSFIGLQKDTALLAIIGAVDAFNQAKIIAANHFNLSAVTTAAILFVLITIPQTRLVDSLVERRRRAGGV